MLPLVRRLLVVSGFVGLLLLARPSLADLVTFQSPHTARAAAATLDDELSRSIERRIKDTPITSVDALLQLSLDLTAAHLHFGLAHKTSLAFGSKEREGNCIEYAHLFASIFNRGADRKHIAARAFVVHSDARVLGQRLSTPGLNDHDWVLVVPSAPDGPRLFVDPTFYDFGLAWDISRSVSGDVRKP